MPPKGWKKGPDGEYRKEGAIAGKPRRKKTEPEPDMTIGQPDNVAVPPPVSWESVPEPKWSPPEMVQVNRLEELLRAIPDASFVQMASGCLGRDQARELVELFRMLKT